MSQRTCRERRSESGAGIVEVMISIVISMLIVLVIFQVYMVSEAQKRTITSGSDAQENASYGLFLLARDLSMAGNGLSSAQSGGAMVLKDCAIARPIPALITAGATGNDPDTITVFYGGSGTLATPAQLLNTTASTGPYLVGVPVGFSAGDLIAAVQGANCTLSTINAGGVAVDTGTGIATLTHTPIPGSSAAMYNANVAWVVNLGQPTSWGRITYSVDTANCPTDPTKCTLRTQNLLSTTGAVNPVVPVIGDVVNLKAHYGLDTDNDGTIDTWQEATGAVWSAANLPAQPPATWQQARAIRVAIVTRSAQYERGVVTPGPILMFHDPVTPDPLEVSMTPLPEPSLQQYYRYKELETIIPLRNPMFNSP